MNKFNLLVSPPRLLVIGLVCIVYLLIIGKYVERFHDNYSGFACIGDKFPAPGIITEKEFVEPHSDGYDGQFFYQMCHDLLIRDPAGKFIDSPSYRYQRIFYPLLSKILSFGHKPFYSYTLILVNLIAILGSVWIVLLLVDKTGWNRWLALLYGFMGGFLLCLLRDLAEPVAVFFFTLSVYFYGNKQFGKMGLSLACMILTREIFILFILILALDALVIQKNRHLLFYSILSLIPWIAWTLYIHYRLGSFPFLKGSGNFDKPLRGFWDISQAILLRNDRHYECIYLIISGIIVVGATCLALKEIYKSRNFYSFALLVFSVFPYFLSELVWVEPWSYGRVLLPLYAILFLYGIIFKEKYITFLASFQPLLFSLTAGAHIVWLIYHTAINNID